MSAFDIFMLISVAVVVVKLCAQVDLDLRLKVRASAWGEMLSKLRKQR